MKRRYVGIAILLVLLLSGCAAISGKPSNLTPSQEFLMNAEKAYLVQYYDYLSMTKLTNPTPDQIKVMHQKRALLVQAEPLIKIYRSTVMAGGVPSIETEQQINDILNQLGGKL